MGRALSLALARAGCDVAVNYRERRDDADSAVQEIIKLGRRAIAIRADVSRGAEVTELVRTAESQLGPIEILMNNAGKILIQPIDQMTEESWNDMIASNLTSCFLVTQAVLSGMRARHWGTHRQHVVRGGASGQYSRRALCGVESRDDRADAQLRASAGERGHHRQRHHARPGRH